ncbi:hypothetical protein [Rhodococcus sp. 1139]|uniref:hypothetical protein n=1 Tax=Rhodococcus sp. 1139 TaxID=1833762 RepID=UPI00114C8AA1|nr:hypothetical protein [Rhodococcus sp. 1139]
MNSQRYERSTDALQALLWSKPSLGEIDPLPLAPSSTSAKDPHAVSNCASCGTSPSIVEPESSCNDVESAIEPGWTFTAEESYCPICADVRAHTWGARRQDDEPKGKKR